MKNALLIIGLFVFAGTANIFAQAEKTSSDESLENVAMLADKAAAADDNIEKKVCEHSGKVSYVRKDVCEKSGKVSYTDVTYDATAGKFVSLESAEKGKACGSKAKASGCCASKGKASGVAAKDGKGCGSKGKAAGCCSSKNKAKAAKAKPALAPQG